MTALGLAIPVTLWAAVVLRTPAAMRDRRKRLLWFALAGLAVYATLDFPPVALTVDGTADATTNVSHLIKYLAALLAAVSAYEVVRHGYFPPEVARRGWKWRATATAGFMAVLVPLFVLSPVREGQTDSLMASYSSHAAMAAFLAVFFVAMGAVLVAILRHTVWYCRQLPAGSLRTSMAIIAAGTLFGLAFVAFQLVLVALTPAYPATVAAVAPSPLGASLLSACLLLIAVGTGWRVVIGQALDERLAALRGHRDLRQLWTDLHDVVPSISLEHALTHEATGPAALGHRHGHLVGRHEIRLRYRRRVVEILDGELALRPYVCEQSREAAREAAAVMGVPAERRDAVVERAVLEVARRRRLRGDGPITSRPRPRVPEATTFEREAERLRAVARSRPDGLRIADMLDRAETPATSRRAS